MSAATIREALEKAERVFAVKPELAAKQAASATARIVDGLRCDISGPAGERASSDMVRAFGGAESAPSPGWYLRAGMAACTATGITMRAAKLGIVLTELEVSVHARADARGWLGMGDVSAAHSELRMHVRVGAEGLSAQRLRELVEWCEAHSAVSCTVRADPKIDLDIEVV